MPRKHVYNLEAFVSCGQISRVNDSVFKESVVSSLTRGGLFNQVFTLRPHEFPPSRRFLLRVTGPSPFLPGQPFP